MVLACHDAVMSPWTLTTATVPKAKGSYPHLSTLHSVTEANAYSAMMADLDIGADSQCSSGAIAVQHGHGYRSRFRLSQRQKNESGYVDPCALHCVQNADVYGVVTVALDGRAVS